MSKQPIYSGYPGILWQAVFAALSEYYNLLLQFQNQSGKSTTGASISAQAIFIASRAMLTTLKNASEAINIYQMSQAWAAIIQDMNNIGLLNLNVAPADIAVFTTRTASYSAALTALKNLIINPPYGSPSQIANGIPIVPYPGLLEFLLSFNYEPSPIGLTAANLPATAAATAQSLTNIQNAIAVFQGNQFNHLYDVAALQANCATYVSNVISQLISSFTDPVVFTGAWNLAVAWPTMTMASDYITSAPFTAQSQQQQIIRYACLNAMISIANFILSLRNANISQATLTTLLQGESLMDVAARTLGDYTQWQAIAEINGLVPPYTGPNSAPGIAGYGTILIVPSPGTALSVIGQPPSYANNFLGTDLYLGPINGPMPPWTGDFQVITGYKNLTWALGRRLQTKLGSLMFHSDYGSRIPPEIGNIQIPQTAQHIAAYGKSAILADPRVQSVPFVSASGSVSQINFAATVNPGGFQTAPLQLNEVILPTP